MRTLPRLVVTILLASVGAGVAAQDGIHPVLQQMGSVSANHGCRDGAVAAGLPAALSAVTGVAVRADGDWREALPKFEALVRQPRFADCVSQQVIAAVALQAVLLAAPPAADAAIAGHLRRLVEHGGVSFVAMVEALDRVRDDLPATTVRHYEREITARYHERFDPACSRCTPAEAEWRRRAEAEAADEPRIWERVAPERRAQIRRQAERHVAARERILAWDS